ncbi:MAG TPA: SIMPL domain-containing protein [Anaerolineales bacterium]|nr:SIMPL domain-containing protein [Anaerolineales bacterium]
MFPGQAIHEPFGVTTYGSTVIRVDPDVASIKFAVSRIESHPKDAFKMVREESRKVTDYLQSAAYKKEASSSRISLTQTWDYGGYGGATRKLIGYTARADFHILLYDLEQLENLLVGIVDSGVNEIRDVNFQTSRLKELRAEARRKAVEAATAKAENYCIAAKVKLGRIIHIEDVNPDSVDFFSQRYAGHAMSQNTVNMLEVDDPENVQAFNPGGISINAAVLMSFNIANE